MVYLEKTSEAHGIERFLFGISQTIGATSSGMRVVAGVTLDEVRRCLWLAKLAGMQVEVDREIDAARARFREASLPTLRGSAHG